MNAIVGNYIANEIGVPLLVDAPKSGLAWGPFLRIRVDVDITKPLMRDNDTNRRHGKRVGLFQI